MLFRSAGSRDGNRQVLIFVPVRFAGSLLLSAGRFRKNGHINKKDAKSREFFLCLFLFYHAGEAASGSFPLCPSEGKEVGE